MLSERREARWRSGGGFWVFCGVDVAKEAHHAVALDREGRRLADRPLPNDEAALRALFADLATHGPVLVVVDQPASIGALAIAVARSMGIEVGYLPGLAMRRIADLYPGEGKTDARDAFVIADAARTLPHALRRVGPDEQAVTALGVLAGYDTDLAEEATRLTNRLHDALLHVHPALERLLGKYLRSRGVLQLLAMAGTPQQLGGLDEKALKRLLTPRSRRLAVTLPAQLLAALAEQTVVIPATAQYGRVISGVAAQLLAVLDERGRGCQGAQRPDRAAPHGRSAHINARRRPKNDSRAAAGVGRRRGVPYGGASCRLRRTGPGDPPIRTHGPR